MVTIKSIPFLNKYLVQDKFIAMIFISSETSSKVVRKKPSNIYGCLSCQQKCEDNREKERKRENTYSKYFIMEHAHLILTSIHYCHFMVRINLPIIYGIVYCRRFDITGRFVSLESCIKIDHLIFVNS